MGRTVVVLTALLLGASSTAAAQRDPYVREAWNILPPGQSGSVPPGRNSTDQMRLYDALTPLFDRVAARHLRRFFKPARFFARGRTTTERPRRGVQIKRDRHGVPHIRGKTRADVAFGAGWAAAQDRELLFEQARYPGRVAVASVPGINAFGLVTGLRQFEPSSQADAYVDSQVRLLRRTRKGRAAVRDADAWADGLNAWYRKAGRSHAPWDRTDVFSVLAFIGSVFGTSGGNEVRNSLLLSSLQSELGAAEGLAVFRDLHSVQDPEAPVSVRGRAPYNRVPAGPAPGSAVVDSGSPMPKPVAGRQMGSNALLVGRKRSRSRNPLFVAGPQLGYFYPEIVHEQDLHGGGYDVRGVFAVGPFPIIGRGKDYAWSLTSSTSDNVDQFLEELCNPDGSAPASDSNHYRYKGECRAMTTFDAGTLRGAGGEPDQRLVFQETVHGPVSPERVTVGGRPYAVANARATRGRDPLSIRALADLGRNVPRNAKQFIRVANRFEYGFNWHYADDRDIAFYSSGRLPIRHPEVDPALPTLGTGEYDWRGFLSRNRHPQQINPRSGLVLNWNNRPAPGFGSSDSQWSYGSVHRAELFTGFRRRNRLHDVVAIMNRAGTQDLRVMEVWPVVRELLGGAPAPDERAQQAADLVTAWMREEGSRLDRDLDGKVDHPGAAVLDAAFPRIADAVLEPALGDAFQAFVEQHRREDHPSMGNGSSFGGGWYGYIDKDLRSLLGRSVRGAYSRRYCGNGDVDACRADVWAAIQTAAGELAATQGDDPSAWRADASEERIGFVPGVLTDTMRWTNRPTFQQVIEFDGHRRRRR